MPRPLREHPLLSRLDACHEACRYGIDTCQQRATPEVELGIEALFELLELAIEALFGLLELAIEALFEQPPCATRSNAGPNLSSRFRTSTAGASPSRAAMSRISGTQTGWPVEPRDEPHSRVIAGMRKVASTAAATTTRRPQRGGARIATP
jgi:hypothetical protein